MADDKSTDTSKDATDASKDSAAAKPSTPKDDLTRRVEEANATNQDSNTDPDTKTVGDGGVSVPVQQAADSGKGETAKPARASRTQAKRTQDKAKEDAAKEKNEAPGVDPITGLKSSTLAGDDVRNTTLAHEANEDRDDDAEAPGHDGIPDPTAHRDASRNVDDSQASNALTAEADPEVNTDPAALSYQIGQFDPERGVSVLSVLANPPAAAVAAEQATQAGVDATNGVYAADTNGDGVIDGRDERTDETDEDGVAKV